MKTILAIDGGGMRGLIPAILLMELERKTGKLCCEMFDMIAGTSIGGIVGALLSIGVPARDTLRFFTEDGPKIFKPSWRSRLYGLLGPRYSEVPIEMALQKALQSRKLRDCKTRLLLTALDLVTQEPFFFKSFLGERHSPRTSGIDYALWEAARATSAAQSYFPAYKLALERKPGETGMPEEAILWDGGNVSNNPAVCAYAEARRIWKPRERILMLSLGTGNQNAKLDPQRLINPGLIGVGLATLDMLFEAGSEDVDYQMKQFIRSDYVRINPALEEPLALDDASPAGIQKLQAEASFAMKQFAGQLDSVAFEIVDRERRRAASNNQNTKHGIKSKN